MLRRECTVCKRPFETKNDKKVFCSAVCRSKHHNLKTRTACDTTLICKCCDKEFLAAAFVAKRKQFCSKACGKKYAYRYKHGQTHRPHKPRKKQDDVNLPSRSCPHCHMEFSPNRIQAANKSFCSATCKTAHHALKAKEVRDQIRSQTVRVCPICEAQFVPKKTLKEIYCSKKCYKSISSRIYKMLAICYINTMTKKSQRANKVLGYTPSKLLQRLESFPAWPKLRREDWHLDHVYPVKAFLRRGITDISLICALDNLQPLAGSDNCKKNSNYDERAFESWLSAKGVSCSSTSSSASSSASPALA